MLLITLGLQLSLMTPVNIVLPSVKWCPFKHVMTRSSAVFRLVPVSDLNRTALNRCGITALLIIHPGHTIQSSGTSPRPSKLRRIRQKIRLTYSISSKTQTLKICLLINVLVKHNYYNILLYHFLAHIQCKYFAVWNPWIIYQFDTKSKYRGLEVTN